MRPPASENDPSTVLVAIVYLAGAWELYRSRRAALTLRQALSELPEPPPDLSNLMPLDYLLEVMRDHTEERGRRMQAATLAAPYCHPKKGEAGKKEEKAAAAKKIASRFSPAAPPKLVAANGQKV